jgi:biotin transporter BioY
MICWTPYSPNRTCPNILKKTMLNCSGNPLHILIAILVYGVFAIFALAVGLASFRSFSNFVVGATVLLGPVGCYLFAFDLFNIRTRCTLVERFRHTKQYPFYCVCVMLSWLLLCFFVMFLGVGVFDSKK